MKNRGSFTYAFHQELEKMKAEKAQQYHEQREDAPLSVTSNLNNTNNHYYYLIIGLLAGFVTYKLIDKYVISKPKKDGKKKPH